MTVILDASAILAMVFDEPGSDKVATSLPNSLVSAVNLSEVISKLLERGWTSEESTELTKRLEPGVVSFDSQAAGIAGAMYRLTRSRGLSLGDRACLALAKQRKARALTADRAWADLEIGVEIEVIR